MRARITITDAVYVTLALAGLAATYPVYTEVLDGTAPRLDQGPEMIFTTMLPMAVVVLLAVIWIEARAGGKA